MPSIAYWSSPNDEVITLGEALHQRIQWKRGDIVVSSAPPSRPLLSEKSSLLPSPPHPAALLPAPMSSPLEIPKKKENKVKKKGSKKHLSERSKAIIPAKKSTDIRAAWTQANTKFQYGKPMMMVDSLTRAGKACVDLHNYFMHASRDSNATSRTTSLK